MQIINGLSHFTARWHAQPQLLWNMSTRWRGNVKYDSVVSRLTWAVQRYAELGFCQTKHFKSTSCLD